MSTRNFVPASAHLPATPVPVANRLQRRSDSSPALAARGRRPPLTETMQRAAGEPARPITGHLRHSLETSFAHDFSGVRVHGGPASREAAAAVGARAYTLGTDIHLGAEAAALSGRELDQLLAHEAVHVLQQGGRPALAHDALSVSHPADLAEREAEHLAAAVTAGRTAPLPAASGGPRVQRSFLGGLLGGLGGALGGAVLGGLVGGPIGAIIGGVVGLVGGALIGNAATTKSRKLTATEIQGAKEIFQDSIDYSQIEITRDSLLSAGAPRTLGNTIHLKSDWGDFVGDTLELTETGRFTLIHEMTHVWQYQNAGLAYIPLSLIAQLKARFGKHKDRNAAYNWREAVQNKVPWEDWNPEQQAQVVEDYNIALQKTKANNATAADYQTVSLALPYIEKVRHREGAPSLPIGDLPVDLSSAGANSTRF